MNSFGPNRLQDSQTMGLPRMTCRIFLVVAFCRNGRGLGCSHTRDLWAPAARRPAFARADAWL